MLTRGLGLLYNTLPDWLYTETLIVLSPNASDIGLHRINATAHWRGAPQAHAVLSVNVTDAVPPRLLAPAMAELEATGRLTLVSAAALGVRAADGLDVYLGPLIRPLQMPAARSRGSGASEPATNAQIGKL